MTKMLPFQTIYKISFGELLKTESLPNSIRATFKHEIYK